MVALSVKADHVLRDAHHDPRLRLLIFERRHARRLRGLSEGGQVVFEDGLEAAGASGAIDAEEDTFRGIRENCPKV